MSNINPIFQNYNAALCRGLYAEKLHRALAQFTFDGTELHRVIDRELRGPENEIVASNLKHAAKAQYQGTIPIDAAIEIFAGLLDEGEQQ